MVDLSIFLRKMTFVLYGLIQNILEAENLVDDDDSIAIAPCENS
jgi:hypothetical protein